MSDRIGTQPADEPISDVQLTDDDLSTFASLQKSGDYARGRREKVSTAERGSKSDVSRETNDMVDSTSMYGNQPRKYFSREPDELIIDKEFPKSRDKGATFVTAEARAQQKMRTPVVTRDTAKAGDVTSQRVRIQPTVSVIFDTNSHTEPADSNKTRDTKVVIQKPVAIKALSANEGTGLSTPYNVLKSPVTPERDTTMLVASPGGDDVTSDAFSFSTSPVTPVADSSPPKAQSPTLPRAEFAQTPIAIHETKPVTVSITPSKISKVRIGLTISFCCCCFFCAV